MTHTLSNPDTLNLPNDPLAKSIASVILNTARSAFGEDPDTGGCKAFYSREEWISRKESYGLRADLIVVHDGGDLAMFFNYDYESYESLDKMNAALRSIGFYAEPCTSWYTAIYPIN